MTLDRRASRPCGSSAMTKRMQMITVALADLNIACISLAEFLVVDSSLEYKVFPNNVSFFCFSKSNDWTRRILTTVRIALGNILIQMLKK